ncbi:hypothetical protein AAGV28_11410 [Flavobacterium sp. FZUC8N2.13]|uniref:DUF3223 domain-containing protein n=1 Tax=Flavobacterium zubiriense TaxID=3138075 RepID=A0ABV4TEY0_9FLAO
MREIIKIGKQEFKFKKDALLYYKSILNSYHFEELLNKEHFNDILSLLEYDYAFEIEKYRRQGQKAYNIIEYSKIKNIKISKVQFNTKCFELLFEDSSSKQISYTYIINRPKITADSTFNIACRNTIIKDMNLVKRKYFETHSINGQVKCQETNEFSKWEDLVVDHRQPNTFSIIVDRFKEVSKIDLEKIEYFTDANNFLLFKNEELKEDFRNYHKQKATLRVVKKECNSSRAGMAKIKKNTKDLSID